MSGNYFVIATSFAKSSTKSVSTKTIAVFNFTKYRFASLKKFMVNSNFMAVRAFCIIRPVVYYMPTKNLFSGFNFLLAALLVYSLILPLIELYEYLEFGVVYKWEGDFVPRLCRFVKAFWHYDIWVPRAQDGQNQEQNEPPRMAEFLLGLLAKKRYRNAILRDLADDFDCDLTAGMSLHRAKRRYWAAALNSIGPQALAAIKRIGIVGLVFDHARRWMG